MMHISCLVDLDTVPSVLAPPEVFGRQQLIFEEAPPYNYFLNNFFLHTLSFPNSLLPLKNNPSIIKFLKLYPGLLRRLRSVLGGEDCEGGGEEEGGTAEA